MLTEKVINELKAFTGDEDRSLWTQGDILVENEITKEEVQRLSKILQQSPAKLLARQFVSAETPSNFRNPTYSWSLYQVFTKISDAEYRWDTMFSRKDWTLTEAKEVVRTLTASANAEQLQLTRVARASLKVGNVTVKAKLNPKGQLTLLVSLGGDRVCEVTPQTTNTRIVFPA